MPSRLGSVQPRRTLVVAIALAVALGAAGCRRHPKLPDGDVAATLAGAPVGAHAYSPASLAGKPALVMFVTPTCPHCLAIIPRGAAAAKAADATAVAVFVAGKPANAAGVVQHARFEGPALVDDGTLRRRYAVRRVPYTLVLGADGHARDAYEGEQSEETLRDALRDAR